MNVAPDAVVGPHYTSGVVRGFGNSSIIDDMPAIMLHLVDEHWYQYAPLSRIWYVIVGSYMLCIGLVSGIGNGLVCYLFMCESSLRTPSNLLVVNLAFADFCMVFYMVPVMVYNSIKGTWSFGPFACALYGVVGSVFGVTSIWTMVFIALDRYNVIVKGIAGKKWTMKSVTVRLAFIWIHALIWTLAPLFDWNRYVPEGNMTSCGTDYFTKDWWDKSYILAYSVFAYFIPLFTIIWAYYNVTQAVFEHEKSMRDQAKKMNVASLRADDSGDRQEFKIARVSLMVTFLWFIAWTPYLIINYAGIFDLLPLSPLGTLAGAVFSKTNAIYNPIVYGISHPKFRAALNQRMPCLKPALPASDTVSRKTADTVMQ